MPTHAGAVAEEAATVTFVIDSDTVAEARLLVHVCPLTDAPHMGCALGSW